MLLNKRQGRCQDNNHRKKTCDSLALDLLCPGTGGQRFIQETIAGPGRCPSQHGASPQLQVSGGQRGERRRKCILHFVVMKSTLPGSVLLQSSAQALLFSVLAPHKEFEHLSEYSWEIFQLSFPQRKDFSDSSKDFQQWPQVSPLQKSICQAKTQACGF